MTPEAILVHHNTDPYVIVFYRIIFSTHRAIKHVLDLLTPFSTANGGPLTLDHVVYVEGRGNLIIGYTPEGASGTIGFVGSHLDVVPADKDTWERNPFELIKDVSIYVSTICVLHASFEM